MKKPELKRKYPRIYLGQNKYKEAVWLSAPSWECDWYWSFGHIGNNNFSSHIDTIEKKNTNLYDSLKKYFPQFKYSDRQIWRIAEYFKSCYFLQESAEFYNRGGASITNNELKELLINNEEVERINFKLLPELFEVLYNILENPKKDVEIDLNITDFLNLLQDKWESKNTMTYEDLQYLLHRLRNTSKHDSVSKFEFKDIIFTNLTFLDMRNRICIGFEAPIESEFDEVDVIFEVLTQFEL